MSVIDLLCTSYFNPSRDLHFSKKRDFFGDFSTKWRFLKPTIDKIIPGRPEPVQISIKGFSSWGRYLTICIQSKKCLLSKSRIVLLPIKFMVSFSLIKIFLYSPSLFKINFPLSKLSSQNFTNFLLSNFSSLNFFVFNNLIKCTRCNTWNFSSII